MEKLFEVENTNDEGDYMPDNNPSEYDYLLQEEGAPMFYINPPLDDRTCAICGRAASELQNINDEFSTITEDLEEFFNDETCERCLDYQVSIHKKMDERIQKIQMDGSGECIGCLQLRVEVAYFKSVELYVNSRSKNATDEPDEYIHQIEGAPMFYINPPPDDNECEICGRPVSELQPFNDEFIKINQDIEERLENIDGKSLHMISYITPDGKLSKRFRSFCGEQVDASWECRDCFPLSNRKAVKKAEKLWKSRKEK